MNYWMSLESELRELMGGEVGKSVKERMLEFASKGTAPECELFSEMCFCILTANYAAEPAMRIQDSIGEGFTCLSEKKLANELKKLGYRYPNARAAYIVEARRHSPVKEALRKIESESDLRDWVAANVKGLGMKEASHFLRNIGFTDLAIIDFHIIDALVKYRMIKRPKTLTRKRYLEIEGTLRRLADKVGVSLAELDLYLWYMETGKILK